MVLPPHQYTPSVHGGHQSPTGKTATEQGGVSSKEWDTHSSRNEFPSSLLLTAVYPYRSRYLEVEDVEVCGAGKDYQEAS